MTTAPDAALAEYAELKARVRETLILGQGNPVPGSEALRSRIPVARRIDMHNTLCYFMHNWR